MTESPITWNIPNPEKVLARLEELEMMIELFPDSILYPDWLRERAMLESLPI